MKRQAIYKGPALLLGTKNCIHLDHPSQRSRVEELSIAKELRINEQIRVPQVRLLRGDEQLGIVADQVVGFTG